MNNSNSKRAYQAPELRVVTLRNTSIIATSTTQQTQQNETLLEGNTSTWQF